MGNQHISVVSQALYCFHFLHVLCRSTGLLQAHQAAIS